MWNLAQHQAQTKHWVNVSYFQYYLHLPFPLLPSCPHEAQ